MASICGSSVFARRLLKASFLSEAFDGLKCPTAIGDTWEVASEAAGQLLASQRPKGALHNGIRGRGNIAKFEVLLLPSTSCSSTPHEPSITHEMSESKCLRHAARARIRAQDPTPARLLPFTYQLSCSGSDLSIPHFPLQLVRSDRDEPWQPTTARRRTHEAPLRPKMPHT